MLPIKDIVDLRTFITDVKVMMQERQHRQADI